MPALNVTVEKADKNEDLMAYLGKRMSQQESRVVVDDQNAIKRVKKEQPAPIKSEVIPSKKATKSNESMNSDKDKKKKLDEKEDQNWEREWMQQALFKESEHATEETRVSWRLRYALREPLTLKIYLNQILLN